MKKKRISLIIVNLMALLFFAAMWLSVWLEASLTEIDRWISVHMFHMRIEWLNVVVKGITDMNSFAGAALFSAVVISLFIWKRWYRDIWFYLVVTFGATALFAGIKAVVGRMRPDAAIIETGGFSFPSGHTTMATAMAFALYFILRKKTKNRAMHALLFVKALGWSLLIASTRLYLGVHWFTDVLGGFGLGLWWVTLIELFCGEKQRSAPNE